MKFALSEKNNDAQINDGEQVVFAYFLTIYMFPNPQNGGKVSLKGLICTIPICAPEGFLCKMPCRFCFFLVPQLLIRLLSAEIDLLSGC